MVLYKEIKIGDNLDSSATINLFNLIKPYFINIPKEIEVKFFNENLGATLKKTKFFGIIKSKKYLQITIHPSKTNYITIGTIGLSQNRIEDIHISNFENVFHSYLDIYINFEF